MSALSRPGDPLQDPKVLSMIENVGLTAEPPPVGTWENFTPSTVFGLPRGAFEFDATGQRVFGDIGARARWIGGAIFSSNELDAHQEAWALDEQYQEDIARNDQLVREKWAQARSYRPDPLTTGAAGQIGNELAAIVPRTVGGTVIGGPVGGAVAAGVPAGMSESDRLQQEGVDPATANKAGAITGVTTAAGAVLPGGGIVKGVVADTTLAAAGNVGLGVAQRKAVHEVLADAGYQHQADQYRALDKTAMATDLAFSLVLSGTHRLTTRETNAVLASRNAQNFARADGLVPTDAASGRSLDAAKTSALDSLLAGEPTDVAADVRGASALRDPARTPLELPEEVHAEARAEERAADAFELVADRIIGLESGGRARAKNSRSTATGAGQFVQRTWLDLLQRERPDLTEGRTRDQLLELRNDPDLSREMVIAFARANGRNLEAAGLPATPANLYLAHHFGSAGAVKMLRAPADSLVFDHLNAGERVANPAYRGKTVAEMLVFDHLNAGERVANPAYRGKTVAEMLASFERRAGARGDRIEFPHQEPDVATGERSVFEQPDILTSREFMAKARDYGVDEDIAAQLVPATPVDHVTGFYDARLDQVKAGLIERAQQHVEATGEPAYYLSADVHNLGGINTLVGNVAELADEHYSALTRILREEISATGGDVVPLRTGGDELGAVLINVDAARLDQAVRNVETRVGHYAERAGLSGIPHHKGEGHSGGVGLHIGAAAIRPGRAVADILERADRGVNISKNRSSQHVARNPIRPTESARPDAGAAAGRGPGEGEGVRSGEPGRAGSEEQRAALATSDALRRIAAERPRQQVVVGTDIDGKPVYLPLADALARLEAERAAEIRDARAFRAGVDCYIRNGA